MFDYYKLAETSERLITDRGRSITFIQNPETPVDSTKPWKAQTGADVVFTTKAVFLPPRSVTQFGLSALGQGTEFEDLIASSEYFAIFFPGTIDCRNFIKVQDGLETFGIKAIQILQPGDVQLLGLVGMRR